MTNPFHALAKASRLSRKGRPLSAAIALQRSMLSTLQPKRKRKTPKADSTATARRPTAAPASLPRPAPGSFIDGRFDSGHGMIAYKLYTPQGSARRRMPLVVMLHGCNQTAADFAAGTAMNALADELGFIVLYPEKSASSNLYRCWNWHQPGNQQRGRGEPAAIAALTRHAMALTRANPARVYIAGISAGGAAAAIIGTAYPDIFAAVGVHSGVATGRADTLSGALAAMRTGETRRVAGKTARPLPTIVFQGDEDRIVHPANAVGFLHNVEQSTARRVTGSRRRGRSAAGRDFTRTQYRTAIGEVLLEEWTLHGSGHAWSGGARGASYTDPDGPDASREMLRFFLKHRARRARRKA